MNKYGYDLPEDMWEYYTTIYLDKDEDLMSRVISDLTRVSLEQEVYFEETPRSELTFEERFILEPTIPDYEVTYDDYITACYVAADVYIKKRMSIYTTNPYKIFQFFVCYLDVTLDETVKHIAEMIERRIG